MSPAQTAPATSYHDFWLSRGSDQVAPAANLLLAHSGNPIPDADNLLMSDTVAEAWIAPQPPAEPTPRAPRRTSADTQFARTGEPVEIHDFAPGERIDLTEMAEAEAEDEPWIEGAARILDLGSEGAAIIFGADIVALLWNVPSHCLNVQGSTVVYGAPPRPLAG